MSKLTKILGVVGAILLIFLDIREIWNCFTLNGVDIFNNIINNSLPCGLLLGVFTLYAIHNESPQKALSITTLVFFVIAAFFRTLTLVLYILERIYASYAVGMIATDYLDFAEFFAFGLLAFAVIFLMIYLLKNKFEKTSLALCGIALVVLCIVWVINIYSLINEGVNISSGISEVIIAFLEGGLAADIVIILAYLAVFWILTTIMKNKEKA